MTFTPSIPEDGLYSFESQVRQYPDKGRPGIGYFAGETDYGVVDCLLYRSVTGEVIGILNHYGEQMLPNPLEQPGNVNVWVRPDRRGRGIGIALIKEAKRRWTIDLDQQRFTPAGAGFAQKLRDRGIL